MKIEKIIVIVLAVIVLGAFTWREFSLYQTLGDVIEPKWNEESEIQEATLVVYDTDSEGLASEVVGTGTTNDTETIEEILNEVSTYNLKRNDSKRATYLNNPYILHVTVTNETGEDYYVTDDLQLSFQQDAISVGNVGRATGYYEIQDEDINPLDVIEELVESDALEWEEEK